MNCPQCQVANGPGAARCASCGARIPPNGATLAGGGSGNYPPPPGAPQGPNPNRAGAPTQHGKPQQGYSPAGAPTQYAQPQQGYNAPGGYGAPGGYNQPPPGGPGYPPGPQGPWQAVPQGQYQPGPSGQYGQRGRSSGTPPASFDLTRLTKNDKIIAVATLVTMISLFLSWFTATQKDAGTGELGDPVAGSPMSTAYSGTSIHGYLWVEFIIALALLGYLVARAAWARLPFNLPAPHERLLAWATAAQLLLILIAFVFKPSNFVAGVPSTFGNHESTLTWSWGFGAFLGLAAAITAVYPAAKSFIDRRKSAGARPAGPPRAY